jgi:arginase
VDVCLIEVPSMAADTRHPASRGARRLIEGAVELLVAGGCDVTVRAVEGGPGENRALAAEVRKAVSGGRLPVALAGSCVAAHGVLAGFDHGSCGVVWLDAHGDFNTPESSASGFFPGMSVAVITGHCYADYWSEMGDSTPVPEERVVMIGVRDLSPEAERERVGASKLDVIPPNGDVDAALGRLAQQVDDAYLHVDLDAFDPDVSPGVVDEPVPGGLSFADGERIVVATRDRFRVRAATIATYTPERDVEEKTLRLSLRLLEALCT